MSDRQRKKDEEIDDDILANEENGLSARSLPACASSYFSFGTEGNHNY